MKFLKDYTILLYDYKNSKETNFTFKKGVDYPIIKNQNNLLFVGNNSNFDIMIMLDYWGAIKYLEI